MLYPATEIRGQSRHLETCGLWLCALFDLFKLAHQLVRHALVCVEAEHPIEARLFSSEILLSRITGPRTHEYSISETARDFNRAVNALRINDYDFVRPLERFERGSYVLLFVESDNDCADFHLVG